MKRKRYTKRELLCIALWCHTIKIINIIIGLGYESVIKAISDTCHSLYTSQNALYMQTVAGWNYVYAQLATKETCVQCESYVNKTDR